MTEFLLELAAALVLSPLLTGIVNKTKAKFAGRRGASVFQLYYDLAKLLRKSSPRSLSSTWIFDIAPLLSLTATLLGGAVILFASARQWPLFHSFIVPSSLLFIGFYLLGAARFWSVLSARDVASAFPDMGSAREVQFSVVIEGILFSILAFLAVRGEMFSVSLVLSAFAAFVMLLAENCRVPFDDPETHLELTMIHEAMILDNSGPDLAIILYSASFKLWIFAAFLARMCLGTSAWSYAALPLVLFIGVLVGAVESSMARMRFRKTPYVLGGAFAIAALALVLEVMHG